MKIKKTARGFERINFIDLHGSKCSLQQSSLATDEAIWLGVGSDRMHLNKEMACELINHLCRWLVTNSFKND